MLSLALPVVLTYLGIMAMGQVDLICVGRISAVAIGAVGIGSSIFSWFLMLGIGLLSSIEFLGARAHGADQKELAHEYFIHGIWTAFIIGLPLSGIMIAIANHLSWFGINPEVIPFARDYLWVIAFSLIPTLIFTVCRTQLQILGAPKVGLYILLAANGVNLAANLVFVLNFFGGAFGFHSMGAQGSAISTLIARLFCCLSLWAWFYYERHKNTLERRPAPFSLKKIAEIWKLGIPSSLQMGFEVGVFALSTLLAARLSAETLAAHQIVLNIASFTFMVPLAISSATAVLVGKEMGRKEAKAAFQMGWKGYTLGLGFMTFSGFNLLIFSGPLISLFTTTASVVIQTKAILLVAALFQLSDGAQVVGTGALRGLGDTKTSMLANLVGHWGIGLPVGAYLCFVANMGLQGLWIGLSVGLTAVAIWLMLRWMSLSKNLSRI